MNSLHDQIVPQDMYATIQHRTHLRLMLATCNTRAFRASGLINDANDMPMT